MQCSNIPNSVLAADGTCKCTKPGFALEGSTNGALATCLPTNTVNCPAPYTTAVKDNSIPSAKLLGCITPASNCPLPYTFPVYSGRPSVKQECRLPTVDCTYTPFTMKITEGSNLVGCVNPSFDNCPFVAFRSFADNFQLNFCRKVEVCPMLQLARVGEHAITEYTVSAKFGDGSLAACLTLDPNTNKCPEVGRV